MGLSCVIGKLNRLNALAEGYIAKRLVQDHLPVLRNHIPLFYILPESQKGVAFHELVAIWGLSKSTISEIVGRYEKLGLIEKHMCGEDKRSVYIALTDKALVLKRQLEGIESDFLKELMHDLSAEEQRLFTAFLDRMITSCKSCKE